MQSEQMLIRRTIIFSLMVAITSLTVAAAAALRTVAEKDAIRITSPYYDVRVSRAGPALESLTDHARRDRQ